MGLEVVHLPEKRSKAPTVVSTPELDLASRAVQCQRLTLDLLKHCDIVSERWALVLVPFEEGPLGALQTVYSLKKVSPKPVDEILPMYLDHSVDYSIISQLANAGSADLDAWLRRSLPIGVWWDGHKGEPVRNSSQLVRNLARHSGRPEEKQVFSAVRIAAGILPALGRAGDWPREAYLGWSVDSTEERGRVHSKDFPSGLTPEEVEEMRGLPGALVRLLLNNPDNEFESPMRTVEVLRAVVLRYLERVFTKNPKRLDVYRFVDTFEKFWESKGFVQAERNRIVSSMIDALESGYVLRISKQHERKNDVISRGPAWDAWGPVLKCYLDPDVALGLE